MHYQLGLSAPNPDTRNFSRKVSWNFKSFAKMARYILCEAPVCTFCQNKLVFSVRSSLAHLSPKERCVLLPTFLIRKVGYRRGASVRNIVSNILPKIFRFLFSVVISRDFLKVSRLSFLTSATDGVSTISTPHSK